MEVPAPESDEATATGKRRTGVGRAPESLGREGWRGRRAAGTPRRAARRVGGVARGPPRWGEGRGGRSAEGGGLARFRFSRLRRAVSLQWWVSFSPPRGPPIEVNLQTSRRGVAFASEAALPRLSRRVPSAEGLVVGAGSRGEGGVALAFARCWRSAARDRLSPAGSPRQRTGRPAGGGGGCQAPGGPAVPGRNGPDLRRVDSRVRRQ